MYILFFHTINYNNQHYITNYIIYALEQFEFIILKIYLLSYVVKINVGS